MESLEHRVIQLKGIKMKIMLCYKKLTIGSLTELATCSLDKSDDELIFLRKLQHSLRTYKKRIETIK